MCVCVCTLVIMFKYTHLTANNVKYNCTSTWTVSSTIIPTYNFWSTSFLIIGPIRPIRINFTFICVCISFGEGKKYSSICLLFNLKSWWKNFHHIFHNHKSGSKQYYAGKIHKKITWLFWWETYLNAGNQQLHFYCIHSFILHHGIFSPPLGDK